ncbi:related to NAD binding Rossmann fold oxidoreductase [Ramularia collo-cygni]|uniref:D-xylose 1-dehydrogenase (NADP(+), D-xylono-1,5-lactone-forming) n=1 Tax=Ramularia collo-cygni TaxID=112498 RepID=A0A2D3URS2_9PEZI|nr:related to NAD binding Rossmann fold oxidoreductase [Ramularia collo-cygni]CZT18781.1 related to NAD binding Rossmann fold oxidoreductase [Ramularia collo-cygni]
MSWIVENVVNLNNWRHGVPKIKANLKKDDNPLRIGVLSAAAINGVAILDPVQTHPGSIISAIAARDISRAQAQIDACKFGKECKAYGSYAELLGDPNIEAVYIPLPNGLHAEWTIKALEAGKHVLVEKPIAANAEEVRKIGETAARTNKFAVEAFHWRFHPAAHAVKDMVESGKYGNVTSVFAQMKIPRGGVGKTDIRYDYALGGGSSMDLAYVFSACCYFASSDIENCTFGVQSAVPRLSSTDKRIDEAMESKFTIEQAGKPSVNCHIQTDLAIPPFLGLIPKLWMLSPSVCVELEKAKIEFTNFALPTIGHSIFITEKDVEGRLTGKKRTETCFTGGHWEAIGVSGEKWWTTYRYQLESFVRQVRAKESGQVYGGPNVALSDGVKMMELIDSVYDKAGLPKRGI